MSIKINQLILVMLACILFGSCSKEQSNPASTISENFYLRNGNADMPVYVRGNKSSKDHIIFLHGGPGGYSSILMNFNFSLQLQQRYKMVFFDQRYQGNSHGHEKLKNVKIKDFVEDVKLLVNVIKKRYGNDSRVFIMGHSWGGLLGTAFLIEDDYQDNISGYIMVSGGYDSDLNVKGKYNMIIDIGTNEIDLGKNVEDWQKIINEVKAIDTVNISDENIEKLGGYESDINSGLLDDYVYEIPSKVKFDSENNDKIIHDKSYDQFSQIFNSYAILNRNKGKGGTIDFVYETSLEDKLNIIHIPSLIICGKYDLTVPTVLGEIALEKLGSSEKSLKIFEHSGHSPMVSDPDRFVEDVRSFIDKYN